MFYLEERLAEGGVVLLDGATGTELERRGAAMDDAAWCALATLTDGDLLRQVHEDYVRAGADVITANTFASSRLVLEAAGHGERVGEVVRRAVDLAREARDRAAAGRQVAVAGSISHMVPMQKGTAERDASRLATGQRAAAALREMAELLAEAGVDLIMMEMMYDPDLAVPAIAAALDTGLPVWVGFSAKRGEDGRLTGFQRPDLTFAEVVEAILPAGGAVTGVMHTSTDDIPEAIETLRAQWSGPLMAYPDSGYLEMPNWRFVDVIAPHALAGRCLEWIEAGVQVVGGCCGIGVEHIRAIAQRLEARL